MHGCNSILRNLQRRIRQDSEALPIQLDGKDINVQFDMRQIATRSYRKVYDKINVSQH